MKAKLQKPFSYASQQSILQFMDANQRAQLCRRSFSIRVADKSVSLYIKNLIIDEKCFSINNHNYKLGIYRKHVNMWKHVDTTPNSIKESNASGGLLYDLDEYGCRDWKPDRVVTSGDVHLSEIRSNPEENDKYKMKILMQRLNQAYKEDNQADIEKYETEMSFINHREMQTKPPYDFYIQLTITSPRGVQIERVVYGKKLYEARKMLLSALLRRGSTVIVKRFNVAIEEGVLRWPLDLRLVVQNLKFPDMAMFEDFKKVLCDSSFPLKKLKTIEYRQNYPEVTKEVMKNAEQLEIKWVDLGQLLNDEELGSCKRLCLAPTFERDVLHLDVVRYWIVSNKQVGSFWKFVSPIYDGLLNSLVQTFDAVRCDSKTVHVPMNNNTVIVVCVTEDANEHDEHFEPYLTMEVVPGESVLEK